MSGLNKSASGTSIYNNDTKTEKNESSENVGLTVFILLYLLAGICFSIYFMYKIDIGNFEKKGFIKLLWWLGSASVTVTMWPIFLLVFVLSEPKGLKLSPSDTTMTTSTV
jgi:hypothetical protein